MRVAVAGNICWTLLQRAGLRDTELADELLRGDTVQLQRALLNLSSGSGHRNGRIRVSVGVRVV